MNDTEIDLGGNVPHQTLGALVTLLTRNLEVQGAVKIVFQKTDVDYILGELPSHLEPIAPCATRPRIRVAWSGMRVCGCARRSSASIGKV